jgi:hypothetical protein
VTQVKSATLQAVIEVPMSYRQARGATAALSYCCKEFGVGATTLSGYSVLRGLTFVELQLELDKKVELQPVSQATLMHFIISAEGLARAGESDEFALVFAEVFPAGRNHEPEAVLLPAEAHALGLGGMDEHADDKWARLLSCYYNPAAREFDEVRFRKIKLRS